MSPSQTVEEYCLARSRWLANWPTDTRWMIRLAAESLPTDDTEDSESLRGTLTERLRQAVRERYGNPVIIWILLNVVVPIVVRLVIEWWKNRKE